jgi:beta-glucosidase
VAQLYLDFPDKPGAPRLALRGFQRITLKPGETRALTFALSPRDLSSVDLDGDRRVAAGRYRVSVGSGQPGGDTPSQSAAFIVDAEVGLPK